MNQNFLEVINKGVPISTPINIMVTDLLEMSNNRERLNENINNQFDTFMNYLKKITMVNDIEFFMTLCIISDPTTLEKKLHFAPGGFVSSLLFNLNVDNICRCYNPENNNGTVKFNDFINDYEEKIEKRINSLRLITSESKLQKSFPMLYEKFKAYKEYYNSVLYIKKKLDNKNLSILEKAQIRNKFITVLQEQGEMRKIEEIFQEAQSFSIESFVQKYAETFTQLLANLDDIIDYLLETSIDLESLEIDNEKLELYIANQSMNTCVSGNQQDRQRFIYYVSNYFSSDKTRKNNDKISIVVGKVKNESIKMDDNLREGKKVTPKLLYEQYKKFLVNNPDIKVIDLGKVDFKGMSLEEVEMFLVEYLKDLQANWELIPEEELERENIKRINSNIDKSKVDKEKHLERLLELFIAKKEFYGSTDPFFRVKGKNTFDGYIGFLYTNGKVVLDKLFENSSLGKVADGEAIYVMDISDFYRLSHYSKKTLMQDEKVKRIVHSGNWQERVANIIKEDTRQSKTAEEVKKLIKNEQLEE